MDGILMILLKPLEAQKPFLLLKNTTKSLEAFISQKKIWSTNYILYIQRGMELQWMDGILRLVVFVKGDVLQTAQTLASTWSFLLTWIHTINSLAAFISQKYNLVHKSHTLRTKWLPIDLDTPVVLVKGDGLQTIKPLSAETPVLLNTYNKTLALPFLLL